MAASFQSSRSPIVLAALRVAPPRAFHALPLDDNIDWPTVTAALPPPLAVPLVQIIDEFHQNVSPITEALDSIGTIPVTG